MPVLNYRYEGLSSREGFNQSLKHFRLVTDIVGRLEQGQNLADVLQSLNEDNLLEVSQIAPIVNSLLVERYGYLFKSFNTIANYEKIPDLVEEVKTWKAVDLVIAYVHPEYGYVTLNPKNLKSMERIG